MARFKDRLIREDGVRLDHMGARMERLQAELEDGARELGASLDRMRQMLDECLYGPTHEEAR